MSREILERAIGDCFAHLGVTATYKGNGLPPVDIVVLKKAADFEYETGDATLVGNTARFEILIKDVERPLPGDTVTVDGVAYQVIGEPVRSIERKTWEVEALVMA